MNLGQSLHPVPHPTAGQDLALDVEHAYVVMIFGPVDTNEQHRILPSACSTSSEEIYGELMVPVLNGTTSHQPFRPPHSPAEAPSENSAQRHSR